MEIRLIVIDLDGTLLTDEKKISSDTESAIREALGRGVQVVLSSARPPRTTIDYHNQLGLTSIMVNYNGALVWIPRLGEVILHRPIPVAAATKIITVARQKYPAIRVSGEIGDKWYTDFYDGKYQTETAKLRNPDMVAPIEQWLTRSVTKLLLLGKTEWLREVDRYVRDKMAGYVRSVQTDDYLLQIMNSSASKLEALKAVSRRLHIPREQIMAIGDNNNDVGMVQWAGFGVCMENGSEMCLKHADFVTDSNENDGVARAIREFVLDGGVSDGFDEGQ